MNGYEICEKCKGKKELTIYFKYKGKQFHYYEKCGNCYATGKIDWVQKVRGRRPGILGMFMDTRPAGSMIIDGTKERILGGMQIYDGHEYVNTDTERGEAILHELHSEEE
jgi:hypothetical protein